jgi:hypothetical protein
MTLRCYAVLIIAMQCGAFYGGKVSKQEINRDMMQGIDQEASPQAVNEQPPSWLQEKYAQLKNMSYPDWSSLSNSTWSAYNTWNSTQTWNGIKSGASRAYSTASDKAAGGYTAIKEKVAGPSPTPAPTPSRPVISNGMWVIGVGGVGATIAAGLLTAQSGTQYIDTYSARSSSEYTSLEIEMQKSMLKSPSADDAGDTSYEPLVDLESI